jgi:hypothetical protein
MGLRKIDVSPSLQIEELVKEIIHSPEERIVLEIPSDSTLLLNEINLRLLKFYSEEEGKILLVDAADPMVTAMAQRVGIPTIHERALDDSPDPLPEELAKSADEVAAAPEPKRNPKGVSHRQGGLLIAIPITLFTLVFAIWWIVQPKAVVTVFPKEQTMDFVAEAQMGPAYSETVPAEKKLPAKLVEKTSKINVQVAATGFKTVGVTYAKGAATFINTTAQSVVVPKGSILNTKSGIRFLTDQDVMVPKKTTRIQNGIAIGETYGKTEVQITAEKKGVIGNQGAKTITGIEGKFQRRLQVTNILPITGGTDNRVSIITLEDVKKGEAEARRQLNLAGPEEIMSFLTKDYLFIPELVRYEEIRVANHPEIGAEGETLQTQLDYKVSTLAPPIVELSKLLTAEFEKQIPDSFRPKDRKIELLETKVQSVANQDAVISLTGRGLIVGVLNPERLKKLLKGKTIIEAKEALTRQNELADYRIETVDGGNKLPEFGFQIKVLLPSEKK